MLELTNIIKKKNMSSMYVCPGTGIPIRTQYPLPITLPKGQKKKRGRRIGGESKTCSPTCPHITLILQVTCKMFPKMGKMTGKATHPHPHPYEKHVITNHSLVHGLTFVFSPTTHLISSSAPIKSLLIHGITLL